MDWRLLLLLALVTYVAGKAVAVWLASVAAAFAAVFALATVPAAALILRRRRALPGDPPPVTILKPLKGADRGLYENLVSFCDQDYPRFQLLFAVASPDDPALAVVSRLRRDRPSCDIEVVVSDGRLGCNPKINNIANAYPLAKHGLLLLSDSDIRVAPDFLRRCAAPLADPRVGLVTCFYRCAETHGLWGALEELCVNAHFLPQALLAGAAGLRFAMGAATLVRRRVFDQAGGFGALADRLADDFALGEIVERAGFRIDFADVVVESVPPDDPSFSEIFRHQVRWQRTVRLCNPAGYCGSVLLHGFSLATLALLLFGWDPRLAALAGGLLAAKALAAAAIQGLAGRRQRLAPLACLPLSEWLSFGAWLSGFAPGAVLWRGRLYRILPKGRLVPIEDFEPAQSLPAGPLTVEP
ncbi:MAG: bacteriohopanetetrol glucosamine biosynthesis glycosyltransferase HpnI [Elusimicrobia bacterium]|nr:bacteriohopanetetrol glucosamine biosynthesis glycosyltransferase HpnI [Elusimicrobiota bacterium]